MYRHDTARDIHDDLPAQQSTHQGDQRVLGSWVLYAVTGRNMRRHEVNITLQTGVIDRQECPSDCNAEHLRH